MSIRRNTLVNLAGQLAAVAISLLTVPPYLRLIGEARYGVLLLVWVLLGYFSLFDLGLGQATSQRMATLGAADPADRSRLVWTALRMNVLLGVVGAVVLGGAGYLVLGRYVSMDAGLRTEVIGALPLIAIVLPVNMAASILAGALTGREAFVASTTANTVSQFLGQVIPLAIAWLYSPLLTYLIVGVIAARLISLVLLASLCRRTVPVFRTPAVDRGLGRRLLAYGGWVTISSVVGPLMTSLDRIIIGGMAGSQAITYYSVPYGLAARLLMLPGSLSGVLFPRFAATDSDARHSLVGVSVRSLACVMTPPVLIGMLLVEPFLSVWISPEFAAKASAVSQILLPGIVANGVAMVALSSLQGSGRPDLVARVHMVELPAYLGLLAVGLHLWGVNGAAIAWTARASADCLLLFVLGRHVGALLRNLVLPSFLFALAGALIAFGPRHASLWWVMAAALVGISIIWAIRGFPWTLFRARPRVVNG